MPDIEELKYPIGKINFPDVINGKHISAWIATLDDFPQKVMQEVKGLNSQELKYKYRPEGWNIQQVVNHCIDSHTNSVIRFKWTLTEEEPIIKTYCEDRWAELPDTLSYPIDHSLALLESVHLRWVFLLKSIKKEKWKRAFIHPSGNERVTLEKNLCIYAWHCEHHLHHIKNAKKLKF